MKFKLSTIIHFFLISAAIGVGISYSKIYMFHILLGILLLSVIFKILQNKSIIKRIHQPTKLHYIFYIMVIWYCISLIWSINIFFTLKYLFYLFCGISILLTVIVYANNTDKQYKILSILSIVFFIEIILSLFEAFTNFRLPISPYSPYVVYFGREIKVDWTLDIITISQVFNAPTGFQWNPNNLSIVMVIILPFFLFSKKIYLKILGAVSILTIIIMAGSRGAFLAATLVIIGYLFFYNKKIFIFSILLGSICLFALAMSIGTLKKSNNFKIREIANSFDAAYMYTFENIKSTGSIKTRQILIQNGLKALKESNGLGVGGGCSEEVQTIYGGKNQKTKSMHNFWIELMVDGGILFFIIFILWYFYIMIKLFIIGTSGYNPDISYFAKACSLSLLGFTIAAISASSTIYVFPMWILFGFSITTINNYNRLKYNENIITG